MVDSPYLTETEEGGGCSHGAGGSVERVEYGDTAKTDETFTLLQDHLSGTSSVVDSAGNATRIRYGVWGEARDAIANLPTSRLYTGQEKSNTGLYYYNARWYDSELSRFVQPDSIIPSPFNPLTLDRYSYSRNNPIRYNDPTGHDVGCGGVDCMDYGVKKNGYPIYLGEIKLKGPYDRENGTNLSEIAEEGYTGFSTSGEGPKGNGSSYVGGIEILNRGLEFARDETPLGGISGASVGVSVYVKWTENGMTISGIAINNNTSSTFTINRFNISQNGNSVLQPKNSIGPGIKPIHNGLAGPGETGLITTKTTSSKKTPFTINLDIRSIDSKLFYYGNFSHDIGPQ